MHHWRFAASPLHSPPSHAPHSPPAPRNPPTHPRSLPPSHPPMSTHPGRYGPPRIPPAPGAACPRACPARRAPRGTAAPGAARWPQGTPAAVGRLMPLGSWCSGWQCRHEQAIQMGERTLVVVAASSAIGNGGGGGVGGAPPSALLQETKTGTPHSRGGYLARKKPCALSGPNQNYRAW